VNAVFLKNRKLGVRVFVWTRCQRILRGSRPMRLTNRWFQDVSLRSTWHRRAFDRTETNVTSNGCEKSWTRKDLEPMSLRANARSLTYVRTCITERFQDVSLRSTWHRRAFDITEECPTWQKMSLRANARSLEYERTWNQCHFERMREVLLM